MSGAGFILAINLVVAGLLAGSFLAIAAWDRTLGSARWFALAYALGMANFGIEALIAIFGSSLPAVVVSFATILAAMQVFNLGLADKYRVAPPWRLMLAVFVVSVLACALIQTMPRTSPLRMLIYQTPFFVAQLLGAHIVWTSRHRTRLDTALAALLTVSSLQFLSKPALMYFLGGTGPTPQDNLRTDYALVSQSLGTVFALAVALLVLYVLVRDILNDATERSETDTLSGLRNRTGFERHVPKALANARQRGLPIALVVADLDEFKSVNDTYGHACGDRIIKAFGELVSRTAGGRELAARLGGEEFAVLLPGLDLAAARLFAEGVRMTFAGLAVEGLPPCHRSTASFGVAEIGPDETIESAMQRADEALYTAKRSGRDRVRVSPPALAGPPGRWAS